MSGIKTTTKTSSYDMTITFKRMATMAAAYRTKGSEYHGNTSLRDDINGALIWMHNNIYNAESKRHGNWWDWQVGSPIEISKFLTLIVPCHFISGDVCQIKPGEKLA